MSEYQVNINPDLFVAEFQNAIEGHVADLRNTLRALEDGSFAQRASTPRADVVIHLELGLSGSGAEQTAGRACNGCFLDLTRALINYLDRMIAVQKCIAEPPPVPSGTSGREGVIRVVSEYLEGVHRTVARDTGLTNPRKIDRFPGLVDGARQAALSYFGLRRCLEHHGGVPDRELRIQYHKLSIVAGGHEITKLPYVAAENTAISLRTEAETKVFPAGTDVALTEADIEKIVFTLQSIIAPEVRRCL
jgi:hypothetical protein